MVKTNILRTFADVMSMKKTFIMLLAAAMTSFSLSAEAAKPKKNSSSSKTAKSSVSASTKNASTKTTKTATKATTANFVAKTSSNSKKSSAPSKSIAKSNESNKKAIDNSKKVVEKSIKAENTAIASKPQNDVANNGNVDGETIVKTAMHFIGQPYVWGATGPSSFDCSGFTRYLYKQYDINLDRCSGNQYAQGKAIHKTSDLQAGDLVFFRGRTSKGVGHVGIVVSVNPDGNSFKFVHARNRGVGVDDSKMAYYSSRYVGARRILK